MNKPDFDEVHNSWIGMGWIKVMARTWFDRGRKRRHRRGGPAIEYSDGSKTWYFNGEPLAHENGMGYMRTPTRYFKGPRPENLVKFPGYGP